MESLESELETQSDKFLKELEDVELWIQNAYSLMRQEPARAVEGIYTEDEMDAEEAEVMGQRSRVSTGSSMASIWDMQRVAENCSALVNSEV